MIQYLKQPYEDIPTINSPVQATFLKTKNIFYNTPAYHDNLIFFMFSLLSKITNVYSKISIFGTLSIICPCNALLASKPDINQIIRKNFTKINLDEIEDIFSIGKKINKKKRQ